MKLNNKIVLSSIVAAMVAFSGCGESGSTPPAADLTLVNTAYDYFVKDSKIDITSTGSITLNSLGAATGATEANIWKGHAGDNVAIETPGSTASIPALTYATTNIQSIAGSISVDTNWTADNLYVLDGHVKVDSNATLHIQPGTVVAGKIPNSYLLITPGATIDANGTLAAPITFTSLADVNGSSTQNSNGEWGGLILTGTAYTHYSGNTYEADTTVAFGSTTHADDNTSSGILNYVAIKHSGYAVEVDKELNGLSLAGVGRGTTLTNIAIIGGADDGLEIWGGTPNLTGLYVYNAQDDSTDTDLGYRGKLTDVLVVQENVDSTNNHDSACMEFGNDNNTIVTDNTDATQPDILNYTCYSKGGGFYNKNDAGFIWNNVKFVSDKTADYEMVHFRSADAYTTGAKHVTGPVSFYNSTVTLGESNTYTHQNSKVQ